MKIYVFLPCYNEELNITELINAWAKQSSALADLGYELIIYAIDDKSTDSTRQKIEDLLCTKENLRLISHDANKGLNGGLNTAITYFLNEGENNSYMVLMDGDNTHDPKYIYSMIEELQKGFDCVIASRYCTSSDTIGVSKFRVFLSDMARYYYKLMLRVPNVEDYTCGYRIYTYGIIQDVVKNFGIDPVKEKSFACMMEFLYKCYLSGAKFGEVGFKLRYDYKKGDSKMSIIKTMSKSILVALQLRRQRKKYNMEGSLNDYKNTK